MKRANEGLFEGTMVGGLIKHGSQPASEYNKAVADYKKFMSKSQHSKGAGDKVLGFLFDDSLLDDLYTAQKKNLSDVRPMVAKRLKELGFKEEVEDVHFGISGVETERPTELQEKSEFRLSYSDKYGKHAGFEDAKTLQDLQNRAQKLRSKGFKIDKMGRNTSPVKEDFTKKDYDKNEKDNEHSLNTLELVKKFGNSSEKTKMKGIYDRHMKRGHITDPDYSERNKLNQKYYKKLKENFTVQITKTDDSKLVHGSYKTKAEAEKFIRWYKTGNLSKMKAIKIIPESVDPEAVQEGYQGTILAYLKKYTDKAYFKYHKLLVKKGTEGMVKTALTRGVDDRASLIYQYDLPQIVAEDKEGSAYAIGMAKAKKMYNDEPPLEKKTIRKAHHIADKILNNQVQNGDGMEDQPETPKKKIKIGIVHPAKETLDRLWHKRGDKK